MSLAGIQVEIQVRGINGQVTLLSDRVQIKRVGAMARLTQAGNSDKDMLISTLQGVRIRLPSLLSNGYIRFYPVDSSPADSSLLRAASDANTVLFSARQLHTFAKLKTEIEKKIAARIRPQPAPPLSAAIDFDQLDQLNEQYKQGLISKAEWVSAKRRLLRL